MLIRSNNFIHSFFSNLLEGGKDGAALLLLQGPQLY